ncbi:hypothetical protein BDM02DRAFT_3092295, partial [Thelephora ganbajun]
TADGEVKTNEEGDKYVDLGRKRRATVRVFKGTSLRSNTVRQNRDDTDHRPGIPLIDIREYFDSGKDQKPGKKGISLKLEEWQALKQNADAIDAILSNVKTKD